MTKLAALALSAFLVLTFDAQAGEFCELRRLAQLEAKADTQGIFYIPVAFGERKTWLAVVTGGVSEIRQGLVAELGLHPEEIRTPEPRGAAGDSDTHHVIVPSLRLGDYTIRQADLLVLAQDDGGRSLDDFGGYLGTDHLSLFDVEIDGPAKSVSLYQPDKSCSGKLVRWTSAWTEIPFRLQDDIPELQAAINGEKIVTALHTGASRTLMNLKIARRLFGVTPSSPGVRSLGEQSVAGGNTLALYSYTFKTLNVSGLIFENVDVVLGDFEDIDLALGMREIRQLHLYIAYGRKVMYATRAGAPK